MSQVHDQTTHTEQVLQDLRTGGQPTQEDLKTAIAETEYIMMTDETIDIDMYRVRKQRLYFALNAFYGKKPYKDLT